jgi:hypothetical protein
VPEWVPASEYGCVGYLCTGAGGVFWEA